MVSQKVTTYVNYLLHRYNQCHAIDTIIQLYMIVGLGIKLKSMFMEVRKVEITLFASKSLYCSKGAPQKGKSELCPYDICII